MPMNAVVSYLKHPYVPYIFPFTLFAVFTYVGPFFNISPGLTYAFKTVSVGASLIYFWNVFKHEIRLSFSWLAVISGVLVFIIWILSEGLYPQIGHSEFNPFEYAGGSGVYFLIAFRMIGAVLVVPVME